MHGCALRQWRYLLTESVRDGELGHQASTQELSARLLGCWGTLADGNALLFVGPDLFSARGIMRRCDYCGGRLGMIVHRNWMLRFCSKLCKKAYEHKAEEQRRAKDRHLAFLANVTHSPDTSAA